MLYSGGYFCQVIEGSKTVLGELFNIIQLDNRHKNVTMLHFVPIKSRVFEDWAMAFAGIEDTMHFDIDGVLASKDELKMKDTGRDLVAVLDQMVKQHQSVINSGNCPD